MLYFKNIRKNIHRGRKMKTIRVSVPGRICLFGEHQDYLKLPTITAAINLRVEVSGSPLKERQILLHLPDIHAEEFISLNNGELAYDQERDYFKSVFNVLRREGLELENGLECTVRGDIPINSGTSSSSALNVAWARFLTMAASSPKPEFSDPAFIARMAYLAEVEEFGEPGGMMDHFATAFGGVLHMEFNSEVKLTSLKNRLKDFVLGDSGQAKDTKWILSHVKDNVLEAVKIIQKREPSFNLMSCPPQDVDHYHSFLTEEQKNVLQGALLNREITKKAKSLFMQDRFDHQAFGHLLSEHHEVLDRWLGISTLKINRMLNAALKAGAYGGKINGSGGGGCMFAYAPHNPQKVAKAIEDAGGKAYIIKVDTGIKEEKV